MSEEQLEELSTLFPIPNFQILHYSKNSFFNIPNTFNYNTKFNDLFPDCFVKKQLNDDWIIGDLYIVDFTRRCDEFYLKHSDELFHCIHIEEKQHSPVKKVTQNDCCIIL